MKIAVATEKKMVSAHFGHCEGFEIYAIENNKVLTSTFVANPGHEPGVLPVFLNKKGVNLIISGGMGERAQTLFSQNNIEVIVGAEGSADDTISVYLKGELKSQGEFCQDHSH